MSKIALILKDRSRDPAAPVMDEVRRILEGRGVAVEAIVPAAQLIDLSRIEVEADLYALRPGVELGLSLAGILHDRGARIVNSFPASELTADKARVVARLEAHGVPTPRSFIAGGFLRACDCIEEGPAVVKPHRGSAGEGVRVVRSREDLDRSCREPVFVQRFLRSRGEDLKVYVVGREVFALRRPFPARTRAERRGRRCAVDPAVRDLALRCGELLGLELYGVDFLETARGPVAVDVNYLPGMVGVDEAPGAIADYLQRHAVGLPPLGLRPAPAVHLRPATPAR